MSDEFYHELAQVHPTKTSTRISMIIVYSYVVDLGIPRLHHVDYSYGHTRTLIEMEQRQLSAPGEGMYLLVRDVLTVPIP